jgi:hypothetical protein
MNPRQAPFRIRLRSNRQLPVWHPGAGDCYSQFLCSARKSKVRQKLLAQFSSDPNRTLYLSSSPNGSVRNFGISLPCVIALIAACLHPENILPKNLAKRFHIETFAVQRFEDESPLGTVTSKYRTR